MVDRVKVETELPVRNRFNQFIPWAMKKNIDLVHRTDNRLDWRLIKVN